MRCVIRSIKRISVFRVMGLKILGRVVTLFFPGNKYNIFMHFEKPFKMHKIIFLSRKPEKKSSFHKKFR